MHWFLTGLLIAVTGGVVVWTGWLMRRLFTTEPAGRAHRPAGSEDPS